MYEEYFEQLNMLEEDLLLEMANVRGKDCTVEDIDFSFYFSPAQGKHTIRAKIEWTPERISGNPDGTMELFGEYKYTESSSCKHHADEKQKNKARNFFKKYKVLFAAVWCHKLDPVDLRNFFEGRLNFKELILNFYEVPNIDDILKTSNVEELYNVVQEKGLYNLYDGKLES